jgi:hypothetical protein
MAIALAFVSICGAAYCLVSMGRLIKPDTPTVAGYYVFPFKGDDYFTAPEGKIYRDWCLRWLIGAAVSATVFVILIAGTPDFEL